MPEKSKKEDNTISDIEKAIYLNDAGRLQQALQKYMMNTISFYDGAAEGFYHGLVLGLVACLSSKYYICSNRESGKGRFDLQLEPTDLEMPAILMEFKASHNMNGDELEKLAEKALLQIDQKEYTKDLESRGITNIVKYGIAFSGKNAVVKKRAI